MSWPEIPDNATAHARDYFTIWPPNTQRKCMAEIKQNEIEQVRCGRVLERFLRYSDKLLEMDECEFVYHFNHLNPCFCLLHVVQIRTFSFSVHSSLYRNR